MYRKPTKKQIRNSFTYLNIASGKKDTPDYLAYERAKTSIANGNLTPEEYERQVKLAARRLKI